MHIYEAARHVANRFGFDICRVGRERLGRLLTADLVELTPKEGIILDVGANTGRAARYFSGLFPKHEIWSFEPGSEAFAELKAAPDLTGVKKFNLGLSDRDGTGTLNKFSGSEMNSLFQRTSTAELFVPDPACISPKGTEEVEIIKLDTFCERHNVTAVALLKIDTQGHDLAVLRGAERLLTSGKVQVIQCEINFSPLYEGQPTMGEICSFLNSMGFGMVGLYDTARDRFGCLKWCDGLFRRRQNSSKAVD
jgi:FkbM family methyltransferase